MKKIIIENQEQVNYLESLGYEVNSRKDLLAYLAQAGVAPNDPAFQAYHKEYQEFFVKFEAAKAELEKQYVQPLAPDGRQLAWKLDYQSRELAVQGVD